MRAAGVKHARIAFRCPRLIAAASATLHLPRVFSDVSILSIPQPPGNAFDDYMDYRLNRVHRAAMVRSILNSVELDPKPTRFRPLPITSINDAFLRNGGGVADDVTYRAAPAVASSDCYAPDGDLGIATESRRYPYCRQGVERPKIDRLSNSHSVPNVRFTGQWRTSLRT